MSLYTFIWWFIYDILYNSMTFFFLTNICLCLFQSFLDWKNSIILCSTTWPYRHSQLVTQQRRCVKLGSVWAGIVYKSPYVHHNPITTTTMQQQFDCNCISNISNNNQNFEEFNLKKNCWKIRKCLQRAFFFISFLIFFAVEFSLV
jgi:hypothetical protein